MNVYTHMIVIYSVHVEYISHKEERVFKVMLHTTKVRERTRAFNFKEGGIVGNDPVLTLHLLLDKY